MMSPPDFCEELRTFLSDYLVHAPAMSIRFKQFSLIVVEWFSRVENQTKTIIPFSYGEVTCF